VILDSNCVRISEKQWFWIWGAISLLDLSQPIMAMFRTYVSPVTQVGSLLKKRSHDHQEELQLNRNRLRGTIPAALGNLTNLSKCKWVAVRDFPFVYAFSKAFIGDLSLNGNRLSGTIPTELGKLTNAGKFSSYGLAVWSWYMLTHGHCV